MSIEAVSRVFRDTVTTGSDRLVLIALADYANDDGTGVYPSLPKIAAKANCTERTVIRSLQKLQELGQIEERGRTPKGTRSWRVLTGLSTPDKVSPVPESTPDKRDTGPMTSTTPTGDKRDIPLMEEPSIEPSVEPKLQGIDPFDAALEEVFEFWRTKTNRNGGTKFDLHRRKRLTKRLEEAIDAEEGLEPAKAKLMDAVRGIAESEWHVERGHTNFDQIFRDPETVEKAVSRHLARRGKSSTAAPAKPEYETTHVNPEVVALQERARAGDAAAQAECREHGIDWS